jgi:hypothetical protein
MDRKTVTVSVSGPEGARTFSLNPPKEIPDAAWQKYGFTIDDGGVATLEVIGETVLDEAGRPVKVEDWLTKILDELGYDAKFVPGVAPR